MREGAIMVVRTAYLVGLGALLWSMPADAMCTGACCGANASSYACTACKYGETGNCRAVNTCNQTDVEDSVTDSAPGTTGYVSPTHFGGDGVYIPAGTCSWSTPVSWANQNINVIGAGQSATTVVPAGDAFDVKVSNNGSTAAAFRISGITFSGSTTGQILDINTSNPNLTAWAGFFRLDHITPTRPCTWTRRGAVAAKRPMPRSTTATVRDPGMEMPATPALRGGPAPVRSAPAARRAIARGAR